MHDLTLCCMATHLSVECQAGQVTAPIVVMAVPHYKKRVLTLKHGKIVAQRCHINCVLITLLIIWQAKQNVVSHCLPKNEC